MYVKGAKKREEWRSTCLGAGWTSCILKAGESCLAPTWHWRAKIFRPYTLACLLPVGQTGLRPSADTSY